ncbi:YkyA family protein [Bacillus cereus]|uniref:YkyA family protein n=1 Tax=Bacillus cereus TaxID=1396 RepID=UPI0024067F12|nr:YkyA family protein [Bacillus cereus]MDF9612872.1 YkyA family protein [Bacillus cereus]
MKYGKVALVGILSVGILSGCLGQKPEVKLFTVFETAATQEKSLADDKKKLEQLEKQGQELYSEILQEGKEQNKAVIKKIEQATVNIEEREKVVHNEMTLFENEQKRVQSAQSYIDKMKEGEMKKQAEKLKEAYEKRYQSFRKISGNYVGLLTEEKQLFEKLKGNETDLKEISEKVKAVNILNDEIQKERKTFNIHTRECNELKVSFYRDAKIQVEEEK